MDGADISELLQGGTDPVHEVAVTEHRHSKALRWDKWRYVHYQPEDFGADCGELYDLETDPHEARNLYGEQVVPRDCRAGREAPMPLADLDAAVSHGVFGGGVERD